MKIPDFLDNGDPKTFQVLDHYLREEPRADFASGYFNLGGYGLLREALAEVPALRLLLSKEPGRISDGGELYPAGFRADLAGTQFSKRNMELARGLIELLREEKVQVRLFTEGFFHAKAYVFGGVGIVGSSNFTAAGLTSNSELNSVHKQGYAANELRAWFEGFWERSEEYKEDLIRLLASYEERMEREKHAMRGDPDREAKDLAARLEKLERRRSGYIDLAADGDMSRDELRGKLEELNEQRDELRGVLKEVKSRQHRLQQSRINFAHLDSLLLQMNRIRLGEASPGDRRRIYDILRLQAFVDQDRSVRITGVFDTTGQYLPDALKDGPEWLAPRADTGAIVVTNDNIRPCTS